MPAEVKEEIMKKQERNVSVKTGDKKGAKEEKKKTADKKGKEQVVQKQEMKI